MLVSATCPPTQHTVADTLVLDIDADAGYYVDKIQLSEAGDTTLFSFTGAFAATTVVGDVFVDVLEINGAPVNGLNGNAQMVFTQGGQYDINDAVGAGTRIWTGFLAIDIDRSSPAAAARARRPCSDQPREYLDGLRRFRRLGSDREEGHRWPRHHGRSRAGHRAPDGTGSLRARRIESQSRTALSAIRAGIAERTRGTNKMLRLTLQATLMISLVLGFAGTAMAASYGSFTDPTGTVSYLNVQDVNGLFGAPSASLNSLDFTPTNFKAHCTQCPGGATTTDILTLDIQTINGQQISEVGISEGLDYSLFSFDGAGFASAFVTASIFIDVLEIDGISVNGINGQATVTFAPPNVSVFGVGIQTGLMTGAQSIDIRQVVLASGGFGNATRVRISLDNTLSVFHDGSGGEARLRKRDTDFVSLAVEVGPSSPSRRLRSCCWEDWRDSPPSADDETDGRLGRAFAPARSDRSPESEKTQGRGRRKRGPTLRFRFRAGWETENGFDEANGDVVHPARRDSRSRRGSSSPASPSVSSSSESRAVLASDGGPFATRLTSTQGLTAAELDLYALLGRFRGFLGTPIDATHFITAKHIGIAASDTITFTQGPNVGTYSIASWFDDAGSDLRIVQITGTFQAWVPLNGSGYEANRTATIFGRGGPGQAQVFVGPELKGWTAAARGRPDQLGTQRRDGNAREQPALRALRDQRLAAGGGTHDGRLRRSLVRPGRPGPASTGRNLVRGDGAVRVRRRGRARRQRLRSGAGGPRRPLARGLRAIRSSSPRIRSTCRA